MLEFSLAVLAGLVANILWAFIRKAKKRRGNR